MRLDEGVGVDGHEQIGLDAARLVHATAERYEKIAVAGEHGAHVVNGVCAPFTLREWRPDLAGELYAARAASPNTGASSAGK